MEEFKNKIKQRRMVLGICFVLQTGICYMLLRFGLVDFLAGLFMCIIELYALIEIVRFSRILKDEKKLKEMYISENDERKQLIMKEAYQATFEKGYALLILAIALSIEVNEVIAKTLICVLFGYLLLLIGYKIYYSRKY